MQTAIDQDLAPVHELMDSEAILDRVTRFIVAFRRQIDPLIVSLSLPVMRRAVAWDGLLTHERSPDCRTNTSSFSSPFTRSSCRTRPRTDVVLPRLELRMTSMLLRAQCDLATLRA